MNAYIKFFRESPGIQLPEYKSPDAAGMDICASQNTVIEPGKRKVIKTGLHAEFGHIGKCDRKLVMQIKSRSGLASNLSIDVGAGTIDQDYRGEIGVLLINNGCRPFHVFPGDRIAQAILHEIPHVEMIVEVTELDGLTSTVRGEGGFGSTGRN